MACLTGCGAASEEKTVAKALGLEKLPAVTHISSCDSHGGFHGDGVSCIALTFEDDQLEQQLAACKQEQEACGSDYVRLQALTDEQERLTAELDAKTERWVYLNDLKERIDAQQ